MVLPDGTLVIADVGNNANDRRGLTLYYVDEPTPTAGRTTFRKKVFICYPEQQEFPRFGTITRIDIITGWSVSQTIAE